MEEKLREIPLKNYIILGVVIIISILLLCYFYMWFDAYNETKLNKPILNKYMEVINYNELNNYLIENPDTIIYVSVLEDVEIRSFEKKLKSVLKNGEITNSILYLDITEDIKNKKVMDEMKEKYSINSVDILDVPVIMVIDNGILKSMYSVSNDNYDIDRIKLFVNNVRFSSEDEVND